MSVPSNLYAEKIFSEHPVALWPLDDNADYVSLIPAENRDLDTWTISGGTIESSNILGPMPISEVKRLVGDQPDTSASIILTSPNLYSFSELSESLGTFAVSAFIFSETSFIDSVDIGYQVGTNTPVTQNYSFELFQAWGQVSGTFDVPQDSSDIFKVYVSINYVEGTAGTEYGFLINGVTSGQYAEQHNVVSLGAQSETISNQIALPSGVEDGILTSSYGLPGNFGYYIVNKNSLKAKNFSVPMVYGSQNTTTLYSNNGLPSLILPGLGFLNSLGKYQDLSLEFWVRVNSGSREAVRLVGPLASQDGLYVEEDFLTLKIGDNVSSYFVGEWGRPILINLNIIENNANLLINGEQVISMDYDTDLLNLPQEKDSNGKSQDWLGFYSNDAIGPIQLDCVAIYPYQVSETLAKRRFVYGQGVKVPDNINSSYSSTSVVIDYPFANYANNYNYPDIGRWKNGILDNLDIENEVITMPSYQLPSFVFNNRTKSQWDQSIEAAQESSDYFVSLKPDEAWNDTDGYMLFPQLDLLKQSTKAFYGVFERSGVSSEEQTLFKIINESSQNHLSIILSDNDIIYRLSLNNSVSDILVKEGAISENKFAVGLDLEKIVRSFGGNVATFLGARSQLRLFVGGDKSFTKTFSGKIYRIGFLNETLLAASSDKFKNDGSILDSSETDYFGNLSASYTLFAKSDSVRGFIIDILASSKWEDYIPLSYFAKYVKNASNQDYYSVDFLQFNIDYPEGRYFIETQEDLSSRPVKTYITFQSLRFRAKEPAGKFVKTIEAQPNDVVAPGSYLVTEGTPYDDWRTTRYEVVNGSIIYPPAGVDPSTIGISVSVEFNVEGILSKPVKIRSLQFASQALNDISPNPVGSKYGVPIYPYSKLGIYFDYKRRNPFEIYKNSSPYLYLTKKSGIRLRGDQGVAISRGLSSPVNQGLSSSYNVGAIQFFGRYDGEEFPADSIEAFEIEARLASSYIKFYLQALDGSRRRGRIFGVNTATGKIEEGLAYFINGVLAKEPIIDLNEWFVLGVQFSNKLDFGGLEGAIRITGPLLINNLSHYQFTAFQEQENVRTRPWLNVLNLEEGTAEWSYWASLDEFNNPEFLWRDVLFVLTAARSNINPAEIYKIYTGTNKSISGTDKVLKVNRYQYKAYKDVLWSQQVIKPV
jgi:hypothetical protein